MGRSMAVTGDDHAKACLDLPRRFALLLLPLLLAACGDGMKGRFEGGPMGEQTLIFHGNGEATQQAGGMEVELEYEVEGNKIKLRNPDQPGTTFVLTRTDADTLTGGPMDLLEFKRKQ